MVRRILLLCLALFVFSSLCSEVHAQTDDSSGNIEVQLTRLDETTPYTFILIAIAAALILLIATLAMVLKYRLSSIPAHEKTVSIKEGVDGSFRHHGYYEKVFEKDLPATITDEKSGNTHLIDEKDDGHVDRYLKEDEKIIINVLRMKHNSCSQATLRVVTDFSKARLSRLLSELEERGVIYKEQSGRKNIITLKT